MDQGEKLLLSLVAPSAHCLCSSGITLSPSRCAVTIQHHSCHRSGVSAPQHQWKKPSVFALNSQHFCTTVSKIPLRSQPALSGQDENSPGPNSSALNTMTHWRALL